MLEQYLQEGRQIVYGDESGFAVDMPRLSGYSKVGRRCFGLRNFGVSKMLRKTQSSIYTIN